MTLRLRAEDISSSVKIFLDAVSYNASPEILLQKRDAN